MHLACDAWKRDFNLFEGFENKPSKHNQKKVESVHYIKVYAKGMLKQDFVYVETLYTNLL